MPMMPYDDSVDALFQPAKQPALLPAPGAAPPPLAVAAQCARLAYWPAEVAAQAAARDTALAQIGFGPATPFDDGEGGQGFGALRTADRLAVVSIRGTQPDEWQDMLADASIALVAPDDSRPGLVHLGFRNSARRLRQRIGPWLAASAPSRLLVTGHSLGAAVATLLADQLPAQELVTFGSPRVGSGRYAQHLEARAGLSITRVAHCSDLVTMVPPSLESPLPAPVLGALQAVTAMAFPALHALAARVATLTSLPLDYVHAGRCVYVDRHGQALQQPDDGTVQADRVAALLPLPGSGHGPQRLLQDHAPINYVRAFWP